MKKPYTRLSTKVKTKTKLQHKLRAVVAAGVFAAGVFTVAMVYTLAGDSEESIANNKINGIETLAEYKFRKQIELKSSELPQNETLHKFPVMISISDADLKSVSNGGKVTSDAGNDFRFTKADGITLLNYEIEKYDPVAGTLQAWVQIDSLNKETKPVFLYFNNKYAANESGQNAWNKTYKGVWHLRGLLSTKTPWSNQVTAVPPASDSKDVYVAAEKNASQFPCLNTAEDVDITGDLSVSAWVRIDDKKEQTILTNQSGFNGGYRLSVSKDRRVEFSISNENAVTASINAEETGKQLEKGRWYYVAAVYSDKGDSMATYINGVKDRSIQTEISLAGSSDPLQIGREPNRKMYYFGGLLDEVHVANVVRSSEWISTEFKNQSNPALFAKAGATESIIQQIAMSLLTFDAEVQGSTVELKWITVNEIENESFTIERSIDGVNFEPIGTKPGAGNSNDVLSYQFRDAKARVGTNYYRVKLTNASGETEYSMITPVNIEDATAESVKIESPQPNPFDKEFEVSYSVPQEGKAVLKLMNLKGEILHTEEVACNKQTEQHFRFKAEPELKPGVYFFQVAQNESSDQVKLIKRL